MISDQQVSPRIGAIYYVPKTKTALRASFNRLYMPPQVENLLIASSHQARNLSPFAASGGGEDIFPEKLSTWEVGFAQQIPGALRLNVTYWWRRFRNIDDPNVLLGTTIIFPNSVARAEAKGLDVRLDVPLRRRIFRLFQLYQQSDCRDRPAERGIVSGGRFHRDRPGHTFYSLTMTSAMSEYSA